jgi:uridine kinase
MISESELIELARVIDLAPSLCGSTTLVTIDGPAGSGKTTLASRLSDELNAKGKSVITIHMDNLYHGWSNALGASLTRTLSNVVLNGIRSGCDYYLPQFDWRANIYVEPVRYESADLAIVEGVGSGQRVMRLETSISVWIEIADELGMDRVLRRDTSAISPQLKRFQRDQREHFANEGSKFAVDYCFNGAP